MTDETAKPSAAATNRPGRPPRQEGNRDKRDQILDAAETLFASRGFHGVTVREVTSEAGVDVALVYYYFANKRDLFEAVLLRRATIVNLERLDLLDRCETAENSCGLEALVTAFIGPLFDYLETGEAGWQAYFALIAQVNNSSEWGGDVMARHFDPVVQRLIAGLRRVLPDADDEDLYWGYQFLSGALTLSLAGNGRVELLSGGLCRSTDYASVRSRLPRYIAAGFRQLYADRRAEKAGSSS